jgi:hypothetical protein
MKRMRNKYWRKEKEGKSLELIKKGIMGVTAELVFPVKLNQHICKHNHGLIMRTKDYEQTYVIAYLP